MASGHASSTAADDANREEGAGLGPRAPQSRGTRPQGAGRGGGCGACRHLEEHAGLSERDPRGQPLDDDRARVTLDPLVGHLDWVLDTQGLPCGQEGRRSVVGSHRQGWCVVSSRGCSAYMSVIHSCTWGNGRYRVAQQTGTISRRLGSGGPRGLWSGSVPEPG